MRKAAVKASAASVCCPKYFANSASRTSPARRLIRMPAPTEVAATRRQGLGMRSAVFAACQANHAITTAFCFRSCSRTRS